LNKEKTEMNLKIKCILMVILPIACLTAGMSSNVEALGDIDGNSKIGLEEAIYALQSVSHIQADTSVVLGDVIYVLQIVAGITPPPVTGNFVVFSWNDLGMHCLNPSYDTAVILPPYNTVWAEVINKAALPKNTTTGLTAEYGIVNNTYSYGKGNYGQFWDNVQKLFGTSLDHDKGLNLSDPSIHNGLSGKMASKSGHFQADGIPVTPVDDSLLWSPFQIAEITVKNSEGTQLAKTRNTVPTSDEINCGKCHGATNTFQNILNTHDSIGKTALSSEKPVLCASCHGSPALGQVGPGYSGKYLSQAIHGYHSTKSALCYDCHPGATTQCNRSSAHTNNNASDGNCISCHGTLTEIASEMANGTKIPWVNEPKCAKCHNSAIPEVDTGTTLYRNAKGHGGLSCPTCHGSPHAMLPSREVSDNYLAIQFNKFYKSSNPRTIGSCKACHSTSKGEDDFSEFDSTHGGTSPEVQMVCHICHTEIPSMDTAKWPHGFQWKKR
jgi:hypothetical protein